MSFPVTAREAAVRDIAQTLHTELVDGPEGSGFVETVRIGNMSLDVSASRGWGVYLDRVLPSGKHVTRTLRGAAVPVQDILDALAEVLAD